MAKLPSMFIANLACNLIAETRLYESSSSSQIPCFPVEKLARSHPISFVISFLLVGDSLRDTKASLLYYQKRA